MHRGVAAEIQQRQKIRAFTPPDLAVGPVVQTIEQELRASQKRITRAQRTMDDILPEGLRDLCKGVSVRGHSITIRSIDSVAKYRLSQWLRSGGVDEIRRHTRIPVGRVRVV